MAEEAAKIEMLTPSAGEMAPESPEEAADLHELEESALPVGEDAAAEPKRESGVQKRIDELTAAKYEAERQRDRAWEVLYEKEKQVFSPATAPVQPIGPAPVDLSDLPEPKWEDFDAEVDYHKAVARREAKIAWREEDAKRQQRDQESQRRSAQREHDDWLSKGRAKYADFSEVATRGDLRITPEMAQAIKEDSSGYDVAYYLGKNPAEADRISGLSPIAQAKEIGKLVAKLEYTKPKPRTQTGAPAPTQPGGGRGATGKKLEEMTVDEYIAYQNAREFGSRR